MVKFLQFLSTKISSANSLKNANSDPSFYPSILKISLNMLFEKRLCSIYVVKVLRICSLHKIM